MLQTSNLKDKKQVAAEFMELNINKVCITDLPMFSKRHIISIKVDEYENVVMGKDDNELFWDYPSIFVLTEEERLICLHDIIRNQLNETIFKFDEIEFIFQSTKDEIMDMLIPEILTGEFQLYKDDNGKDFFHYFSIVHLIERTMGLDEFVKRKVDYSIQSTLLVEELMDANEHFKDDFYVYGIQW
jgi:hypothetical protein